MCRQRCAGYSNVFPIRSVLILSTLLLTILSSTFSFAESKRIALVIGNSAYQTSPLTNPVNDARLIASRLRDLDFLVMEHLDIDQQTMKRAIQKFGDHLDEAGREATGLFYYAGHGIQVNGENYLIPVNAAIERERDVGIEAVNASAVLGVLDYARTRINFVIIDACRNNPFARSFRSSHRGLARMDAPQGTLVAYATAPGDVAFDGKGANSPYSSALAEAMQQPGLPVEQMFKNVRRQVMAETGNSQVPWESSSLTGNFYFKSVDKETAEQPAPAVARADIDKEALFWQSIKDSKSVEDYEEYLRQFPAGTFVRLAQSRINLLTQPTSGGTAKSSSKAEQLYDKRVKAVATPKTSQPPPVSTAKSPAPLPQALSQAIEIEQNNSIGRANYIQANVTVTGRIDPRKDVDWYMISVRQQGELKIKVTNVAPEIDYAVRVWDSEYRTISSWITPLRVGAETLGDVDLPSPGVYFIELRDGKDDTASQQPYQLVLNFTPSVDPYEPNNSFGTASPLSPGTTWKSTILPQKDGDWYRIDFEEHGELKIAAKEVSDSLDIAMRIWNADKRTITGWYTPLKAGGDTNATIDIPAPGSYILEMRDGKDDSRSVTPFTTTITFTPSVDSYEPNNSIGSAAPLAIGETIRATILPKKDADCYRIDVDDQGELKISISEVDENLDMSFRIWNGELRAITGWLTPLKAGGNTEAIIDLPDGGAYVLEVRDGKDDSRSVNPYALRATYTPTNDRAEPNNSFGTAAPLKLDSTVNGTILPKGDADWYKLSVVKPGSLTVRLSNSPENLDLVMRVWNEEKRTISGWITPLRAGGEAAGEVAIPAAGVYYIEVHDGRDDNRSVMPYSLHSTMK